MIQPAQPTPKPHATVAEPLALGFAAAAAMWAVGYACRLPGAAVPGWILLALLAACVLAAGFVAGRYGSGIRTGAIAGAVAGVINLLVLGSLLRDPDNDALNRAALAWVPGSIAACSLVAALGAALGRMLPATTSVNWRCLFAVVAAATTIVLIVAGGVVTGFEAGLAVPDWPSSYGYNMFLYPLARMTGGIYFEHTHRLLGSLVGLTTLTLTVYLLLSRTPMLQRVIAVLALVLVIVQGLLGGYRVTETNIALAISHGILAQLFLTTLFLLAAMLSDAWRKSVSRQTHPAAAADRTFGAIAIPALVIQLLLGALLRHTPSNFWLALHISSAVLVIGLVGLYATRVWAMYESKPLLTRLGAGVLLLLGLQLMLGFAALLGVSLDAPGQPAPMQVILTTAHQTTGALLLAVTGLLVLWHGRLTTPERAIASLPAERSGAAVGS